MIKTYYSPSKLPLYVCNITIYDTAVSVKIEEVTSWLEKDSEFLPCDLEPFADLYLKWDGCSTFNLQQTHICGVDDWKNLCKFLEWLYKQCSSEISSFMSSEKWV